MPKYTEQELGGFTYGSFINGESDAITKGQLVKLGTTEGTILRTTNTTDVCIGVADTTSAATGARVSVKLFGAICKSIVDTGETVTWGLFVGPGATVDGTIAAVTPAVGNKKVVGIAIPMTSRAATEIAPWIMMAQDINLATS